MSKKQFLIIDGYNLLYTTGMIAKPVGPGQLERGRNLLMGLLVRYLSPDDRQRTTVVFDSDVDAGNPAVVVSGVLIEFAVEYESADARIIELVRRHSAPRQLVVVSSDHEIQRAVAARRATAVDSDLWLENLVERAADGKESADVPDRPVIDETDVRYWMQAMGLDRTNVAGSHKASEIRSDGASEGDSLNRTESGPGPAVEPDRNTERSGDSAGASSPPGPSEIGDGPLFTDFPPDILDQADELLGDDEPD